MIKVCCPCLTNELYSADSVIDWFFFAIHLFAVPFSQPKSPKGEGQFTPGLRGVGVPHKVMTSI